LFFYADSDLDGYGDSGSTIQSCTQPSGYVFDDQDCDDGDDTVYPSALELCDGQNNACSGSIPIDEVDSDGDNYVVCDIDADGWDGDSSVIGGGDCNDSNPSIIDGLIWYADSDLDGYGDSGSTIQSCTQPGGYISDDQDCDDDDDTINPDETEVCDSVDNDCDGDVDDADAGVDLSTGSTFYEDVDLDGYGDSGSTTLSCAEPSGYVTDATDCNDGDGTIYPFADETNGATDFNCDGLETISYTFTFGNGNTATLSNLTNCESATVGNGSFDRYFLYCDHTSKWFPARGVCEEAGYTSLARIESAAENLAVKNLIVSESWFGLNDIDTDTVFAWGDATIFTSVYENWRNNHPEVNAENCVKFRTQGDWEEKSCSETKDFVCYIDLP
jgi:hypothetical protein